MAMIKQDKMPFQAIDFYNAEKKLAAAKQAGNSITRQKTFMNASDQFLATLS